MCLGADHTPCVEIALWFALGFCTVHQRQQLTEYNHWNSGSTKKKVNIPEQKWIRSDPGQDAVNNRRNKTYHCGEINLLDKLLTFHFLRSNIFVLRLSVSFE